jgi:hypothetical protein
MQPSTPRWRSIATRLPMWSRFLLGIPLACVLLCSTSYYWLERPQYIVEDIPMPDRHPWSTTENIVQRWEGSGHRFFIWRREASVFGCCDAKNEYYTWPTIAAYFDQQLSARGWERAKSDSCTLYLAESAFLKNSTDGYLAYEHPGSDPFRYEPTVCLAVWQDLSTTTTHYHVVFVTAQPSFFTELANSFD